MGQITGGRVVYGRTAQPAQYESKKAEAEFSYVVAEGEDHAPLMEQAMMLAKAKVHEMLGLPADKVSTAAASKAPAATAAATPNAPAQPAARTKADIEKEVVDAATPKTTRAAKPPKVPAATGQAISTGENREDPFQMTAADEPKANGTEFDLEPDPKAKVWSDKDVQEAVAAVNDVIKDAIKIKEVIKKYVQFPKGMKDIAQEQRAAFVEEVRGLLPKK